MRASDAAHAQAAARTLADRCPTTSFVETSQPRLPFFAGGLADAQALSRALEHPPCAARFSSHACDSGSAPCATAAPLRSAAADIERITALPSRTRAPGPDVVATHMARYPSEMTIELSRSIEDELRHLAAQEGREVGQLVEDAVRQYLEAAAITDVNPGDVAETQMTLAAELRSDDDWTEPRS